MSAVSDLLATAGERRVLIVGDVMLDEYIWGDADRVSPEAPVPVINVSRRVAVPGGAANAAVNVAGLGAGCVLIGLVGGDDAAASLRSALVERGVGHFHLVTDTQRPTTTKTRVLAHQQQVARFDSEVRTPTSGPIEQAVLDAVAEELPGADACILSDYGKGVLTAKVVRQVIAQARSAKVPLVVDPKGRDFARYHGATVITPNVQEATLALGDDRDQLRSPKDLAQQLVDLTGAAILLTRGAAGMLLLDGSGPAELEIPATARHVFDVTGAGDTVVATLSVALACGLGLREAAVLANAAAGIVVGKVGTTSVSREELAAAMTPGRDVGRGPV